MVEIKSLSVILLFMNNHESIVHLYQLLGYTKEEKGLCRGISLRWLEACLLGEETQFDKRIKKMCLGEETLQSINRAKAKKGKNLTEEDAASLDILAFFDSVKLFQSPREHYSLFKTPGSLNQNDIETISYFASSDKISGVGGLAKVYSYPGIYTEKEITAYLDTLALALESVTSSLKETLSKETFALLLSGHRHAIALTYTQDSGWRFMDINQYPSKEYEIKQTDLLAKSIVTGFNQSNDSYTAFDTSVLTTKNSSLLSSLKDELEKFKKSHVVTREHARRKSNGINLAYIAAKGCHVDVIAELAKHGVDLNTATSDGSTCVSVAVEYGYANVIAELAKHRVDLNQPIPSGITLAHFAALNGHANVIAELAKHEVDLNQATPSGFTLAHSAALNGHANVIAELAKHGVDLNQATPSGITPADMAAEEGHDNVIAELAKYGVDLNQAHPNHYLSMMVLGGFIAAVGVASVAIAFTLLNGTTFGVAGLIVAGLGIGALVSGLGLFATGVCKNRQTIIDALESMTDSERSILQ